MKLFLIHTGFYDLEIMEGLFEQHINYFVVAETVNLAKKKASGRIVNFRFGEGANPNFRQHREVLEDLGLNSNLILKHNNPRQFYLVQLVNNLEKIILK